MLNDYYLCLTFLRKFVLFSLVFFKEEEFGKLVKKLGFKQVLKPRNREKTRHVQQSKKFKKTDQSKKKDSDAALVNIVFYLRYSCCNQYASYRKVCRFVNWFFSATILSFSNEK